MELRHLRYFLAIADTGSVTRAAERCFVAQSALSAQIAGLEAELGTDLFLRSTRGMRLTPGGEVLRPLAARLLADAGRIEEEMAALRAVLAGRLRLGMIQGAPPQLDLVGLVAAFHSRHPGVMLTVRTGASTELAREVAHGRLDLAVVALPPSALPDGLTVTALTEDPLMAVIGDWDGLRPDELIGVGELVALGPFIHYMAGSGLRHSVEAAFERAGLQVEAPFELDQMTDMVRLASTGAGVTILPASVLQPPHLATDAPFGAVPLDDPEARHTISVITAGPPSPIALRVMQLLGSG